MGNTSRLVKNTAFLYIRMAITMLIGLFSVRIVLRALGEVDYGVYNVVSGIVTMLAFLNNALASTTQRFLSYEIPNNNTQKLKEIFSTSFYLYLLFCLLIVILGETVGLWFVQNKLNIPPERMAAANWIYQFSIISFCFSIMTAPYNAAIIAREKMQIYAYVAIVESVLKLALIVLLLYLPGDKLVIYGLMMCLLTVSVFFFLNFYCLSSFYECRLVKKLEHSVVVGFGKFAGWNLYGTFSNIFSGQGINILLNIFFGVLVNAARGIAYQLDNAVNTLVQNFYMAVRPQMVKEISLNNTYEVNRLLRLASIVGFFLFSIVATALILEMRTVLRIWLGQYSELTVTFSRVILFVYFIEVLITPLNILISGTGKIKNFMLTNGTLIILVFPISYALLKYFPNELIPFIVIFSIAIIRWLNAYYQSQRVFSVDRVLYLNTIIRLFLVTLTVFISSYALHYSIDNVWLRILLVLIIDISLYVTLFYFAVLSNDERLRIKQLLKHRLHMFRKS